MSCKPRQFFSQDTIWRDKSGRFGAWREFLKSKIQIFSRRGVSARKNVDFFCQQLPARNYNDIFLAMARNLYILARQVWPWQAKMLIFFSHCDLAPPQTLPRLSVVIELHQLVGRSTGPGYRLQAKTTNLSFVIRAAIKRCGCSVTM